MRKNASSALNPTLLGFYFRNRNIEHAVTGVEKISAGIKPRATSAANRTLHGSKPSKASADRGIVLPSSANPSSVQFGNSYNA